MSLSFYEALQQVALQFDTCANKLAGSAMTLAICYQHELTGPLPILKRDTSPKDCARYMTLLLAELHADIMRICGGRAAIDPFDGLSDEQLARVITTWDGQREHPVRTAMSAVLKDARQWMAIRGEHAGAVYSLIEEISETDQLVY